VHNRRQRPQTLETPGTGPDPQGLPAGSRRCQPSPVEAGAIPAPSHRSGPTRCAITPPGLAEQRNVPYARPPEV
jgi:hypothetical protein